mgnify:FL=1
MNTSALRVVLEISKLTGKAIESARCTRGTPNLNKLGTW